MLGLYTELGKKEVAALPRGQAKAATVSKSRLLSRLECVSHKPLYPKFNIKSGFQAQSRKRSGG